MGFAPLLGSKTSCQSRSMATIRLKSDSTAPNSFILALFLIRILTLTSNADFEEQEPEQNRIKAGAMASGEYSTKAVKSGPGIVAWFLQRYPLVVERLRLVGSRSQRRRNAIVDPLRLVRLA